MTSELLKIFKISYDQIVRQPFQLHKNLLIFRLSQNPLSVHAINNFRSLRFNFTIFAIKVCV